MTILISSMTMAGQKSMSYMALFISNIHNFSFEGSWIKKSALRDNPQSAFGIEVNLNFRIRTEP